MRKWILAGASLGLFSVIGACGSSSTGDGGNSGGSGAAGQGGSGGGGGLGGAFNPGSSSTPIAEAPAKLGDMCPTLLGCGCEGSERVSVSECETWFASPTDGATAEGIAAGLTYDGACLDQTVAAFEFIACATESEIGAHPDGLAAIVATHCRLFYGTDPLGASCTRLTQSNGGSCDQDGRCVDGVCVAADFRTEMGEPCEEFLDCRLGLSCLDLTFAGEPKVCVQLPRAGEPCEQDVLCDTRHHCDEGVCRVLPALGENCLTTPGIDQRSCAVGTSCDEATSRCVSLPDVGAACVADECQPGNECSAGVCQAQPAAICSDGPFPLFDGDAGQ